MEVLDVVETECPIPSMSKGLAAMSAAYEQCYRMQDRMRVV
jgi:TusA-related sulfurtransferase